MTNYLAVFAAVTLVATAACADEKPAPLHPVIAQAAAPATKPAATPAAKPAAAAAPAPAAGASGKHFAQRPNTGSLKISFIQSGAENHGVFKQFATQLDYDEQDPAHGALRVTVQMASLDSQSEDRDTTLASPELFDTQKFPTASYVATSFAKRANGGLEAVGKLTLRGATRDLRLPLALKRTATGYELAGEATIKRLDYGVGQGEWQATDTVGDEVRITYQVPLVEVGGSTAAPAPK